MTRNDLADILASCLDSIERGERTREECLALYPEHREDLEALLGTVTAIRERAGFAPRPSFRLASRARLLRRLPPRQTTPSRPSIRQERQGIQPVFSKRLAALWTTFFVLTVSLIGSGTVYASREALPGDILFPVKRSVEDARLWVSDDAGDVVLGAQFVQVRVEEIQALAASGREEDLELAVELLSQGIVASTESLAAVAQEDPERAAGLSVLLEERLSVHAEVLTSRLDTVPAQARPAIEHAINASNRGRQNVQELFGDERPGGGPPEGVPGNDQAQPGGNPPDETPEPVATQPGGGPPDDVPAPGSTKPGGGPPEGVPGAATKQPGGGPPHGTAGPPHGVPGGRP